MSKARGAPLADSVPLPDRPLGRIDDTTGDMGPEEEEEGKTDEIAAANPDDG